MPIGACSAVAAWLSGRCCQTWLLCIITAAVHMHHGRAALHNCSSAVGLSRPDRRVTGPGVPPGGVMAGQGFLREGRRLGGAGSSSAMREKALPWREPMRGVSSI